MNVNLLENRIFADDRINDDSKVIGGGPNPIWLESLQKGEIRVQWQTYPQGERRVKMKAEIWCFYKPNNASGCQQATGS